jgi:hypothetical protein
MKKAVALAFSVLMATAVAGSAFADNDLDQTSFGALSPNTALLSNNDLLSDNKSDVGNDKSILSHNKFPTDDSFNTDIRIKDSFNDYSKKEFDSHDNYSSNQLAIGQVNVNGSYTGDINAADNTSTILDGDVSSSSGGPYYYAETKDGWGYGGGGSSDNNINTGLVSNSVIGDGSAQFSNVGIAANNTGISFSGLDSKNTSNLNVLLPSN